MDSEEAMIDSAFDSRLVHDLSGAEDDVLTAYQDSLGLWTIGRGHLLPAPAPGKSWKGFTISQDVSDRYFNGDLASAITYATKLPEFASCDTDCRKNALIELCFNMRGKWNGFHNTRAAISDKRWQDAHDGLLNSLWAAQVQPHKFEHNICALCGHAELTGTVSYCLKRIGGRATRLANYFLTGEYPAGV
jgi:lysozyme